LLGIRLIQLAGYDVYYEHSNKQTQAYFAENIHLAALTAAREGVVLAFETMETSFMDTVSKAMSWIKTVQSPYLQIYPDIGNLTNAAVLYNQSLAEDFRTGIGHLAALHLKETLPGRYREVPYGTGHVDFRQVVDEAMSLGIRLFVAEFWHMGETNWQEILKKNNCFLRSFFETTTP
jgi:L-ribulose-5-phosphate 3-epimerase UlaE